MGDRAPDHDDNPAPYSRLIDWMNEPTGLKITTVEITRWNAISVVIATVLSVAYAWEVGSWRLLALLLGGYFLGALLMFMWREKQGE